MASFVEIPVDRLEPPVLDALLQEFASRDGTDYGLLETVLVEKVAQLRTGLNSGDLALLYDSDSEQWDLLSRQHAAELLQD